MAITRARRLIGLALIVGLACGCSNVSSNAPVSPLNPFSGPGGRSATGRLYLEWKDYTGPGSAPSGVRIKANRRRAPMEVAIMDVRYQVAEMALDAGYRHFDVWLFRTRSSVASGTLPGWGAVLGVPQIGAKRVSSVSEDDRIVEAMVSFVDEPSAKSQDALDIYNRLGPVLLGDDFSPRDAPSRRRTGGDPANERW